MENWQGKLLKVRTINDTYHFHSPMARTRAHGFINSWQGDWSTVPKKKVSVGDW